MGSNQSFSEIRVSQAKYLSLLRHVHPLDGQDRALRLLHRIGREGMRAASRNPAFVKALSQKNIRVAGTLAHSALAKTALRYVGAFKKLGLKLGVEETIQKGRGGSRLDIRLQGGKSPIHIIADWKTNGRSALRSVKQAGKHASQTLSKHAGKIADHMALNWQDYLRQVSPKVAKYLPKPKPPAASRTGASNSKAAAAVKGGKSAQSAPRGKGSAAAGPAKTAAKSQGNSVRKAIKAAGTSRTPAASGPSQGRSNVPARGSAVRKSQGGQLKNAATKAARGAASGQVRKTMRGESLAKSARSAARASATGGRAGANAVGKATGKAGAKAAAAGGQQLRGALRSALQGRVSIGRTLSGSRAASSAVGGVLKAAGGIIRKLIGG